MSVQLKVHSTVEKGDIMLLPIIYRENFLLDIGFFYKNTVKNLHYCYVLDVEMVDSQRILTVVPFNSTRQRNLDRRQVISESKMMSGYMNSRQNKSYKYGEFEDGVYYISTDKLPYVDGPITHDSHLAFSWRLKITDYSGLSFLIYKKNYHPELFAEVLQILAIESINYEYGKVVSSMMTTLFDLHITNSQRRSRSRRR